MQRAWVQCCSVVHVNRGGADALPDKSHIGLRDLLYDMCTGGLVQAHLGQALQDSMTYLILAAPLYIDCGADGFLLLCCQCGSSCPGL